MSCKTECALCPRLIISTAVTFAAATGLTINIPAGSYSDGEKYCIVVAQAIPAATTVNAPVSVTIGTGTTQYPLVNRCGLQVVACNIRTRTRYAARVQTNGTTGVFRLLGNALCTNTNSLPAISG